MSQSPSLRRLNARRVASWLATLGVALSACEESPPAELEPPAEVDARVVGNGGFVPAKDAAVFDPEADAAVVAFAPPPEPPQDCDGTALPDPGPTLIRRLNRHEYDHTLRDLLNEDMELARAFLPDEEFLGFDNQAASLQVSPLHAEQYMTAAEAVAALVVERRDDFVDCDPSAVGDAACLRTFISEFGRRAWRRPLIDAEVDGLATLLAAAEEEEEPEGPPFDAAVSLVVQALLQSPNFLFRIEVGEPFDAIRLGAIAPDERDRLRLTDWEVASRLSYLLWQSMPDEPLFEAALRGELATAAQVEVQARRMLADGRSRPALMAFFDQWLRYAETERITRDPAYYPDFEPEFRGLLVQESRAFIADLVWGESRDLQALFDAPYTFLNDELALFYGVPGVTGGKFRRVPVDPKQRAGILTQGAVMAATAKANMTSPVFRGQFVRERILCTPLPPPPPNVPIVPPSPDPHSSTRDKFAEHSVNPACAGCHALMDPIGFGFENFDAVGRWRTQENGHLIDPSCALTSTRDADGDFVNGAELARSLATSTQVQRCVVTQFFRFAHGRGEARADLCGLEDLYRGYQASGRDFLELVVAVTISEPFRFRRRPPSGETATVDLGGGR